MISVSYISLFFLTSHKVHLVDGLHNPGETWLSTIIEAVSKKNYVRRKLKPPPYYSLFPFLFLFPPSKQRYETNQCRREKPYKIVETPHRREIKTRNKHPVPLLENKSDKKPPLPILENHNLCLTFPSQLLADINNPKESPPFYS